jgi:hypothetical protein
MRRMLATLLLLPAAGVAAAQTCDLASAFDHDRFSAPTRIANRWMPLVPGTQFVLEGRSNRGGGPLPHRVILTVTDLTKVIDGVRTVVLWDRDMNEGEIEESELAFHAQDNDGNVWGMGEYPEEYEDGRFHGAPKTWIAGLEGARAGLALPGDPRSGSPPYLQGLSEKIDFYDCGRVHEMGQRVCVAGTCYDSVMVIDEWSPHDPESGHQRKFYAPGVGNVQITAVDDPEDETLVLVKVVQLSAAELADARAAALALEKHARQVSAVYRQTAPAEQAQ